ncbi:hypothetical protein Ocepr_2300 (plasmid) [Oceanithermus profundus DSM 14977]|uniref:Uncharacterized protein n=1 Tax=Oceanithermus profundus (strain DSM 14977 / NBRC 100410 / VKM B-2274 / 506) TaxID=670487 RepID=E4UAW3_OCEP5|nr:hypothetical protein [Oceanithermus profundus]ADR37748.1 hypothetical protein Ocepr_2300 [Oceanithermus profundus DSM 14977]
MIEVRNLGARRARDGGQISNYLMQHSAGYRFNLGQRLRYEGRWRRFGFGAERGPWSFFLTLMPDVYEDLLEHLERTKGEPPSEDEVARTLKEKRLAEVPPLIAIAHRRGGEPRAPRNLELRRDGDLWFLEAEWAGWPWRVHQSLKLLHRILDELQGVER